MKLVVNTKNRVTMFLLLGLSIIRPSRVPAQSPIEATSSLGHAQTEVVKFELSAAEPDTTAAGRTQLLYKTRLGPQCAVVPGCLGCASGCSGGGACSGSGCSACSSCSDCVSGCKG